ncbi:MAG: 7-cyano-7-deazaguanine synthase, partial [Symploca sp. SIO2D2]|nr:7-cyano-7-deazaguanine synthase [Symploca sp. SIO2D2]
QSLGVLHKIADLSSLSEIFGDSGLTHPDTEVPEGHYEEEQMKVTVVPNRNMVLISVATAWAISLGAEAVAYAAHSGDHAIYPDCREVFGDAMDAALAVCDWSRIRLYRPFVGLSKADIVREGERCGAPLEMTWSCYKGRELHCGRCGTCVERREAFHLAGVLDPTPYEDDAPSVEQLVEAGWKLS